MNYFARFPLKFRLVVVLCFLAASVVVGILGRPSLILLLAAFLLFLAGGWGISATRSLVLLLILVPVLIGLLLTHFDWHHPFLSRYCAGLFSVIAVLLLVDGVRVEEWIEVVRSKEGGLSVSGLGPLLIGTAVGTISLASNIREQRACRKLAHIAAWRAKPRASIFLDSVALPFFNAVESHEFIDEAMHRWGARPTGSAPDAMPDVRTPVELAAGNSNFVAQLSDLNDFPAFPEFLRAIMPGCPIPEPWVRVISALPKPGRILEIGDPSGVFANHLSAQGFDVRVVPDTRAFSKGLHPPCEPSSMATLRDAADKHDYIFFHHQSFLEVANHIGLTEIFKRLGDLSHEDGRICLDYPATIMPARQDAIFCGYLRDVGTVDFRYSQHELDGDVHNAWLAYSVQREHESACVRVPLAFVSPGLPDLLTSAKQAGFSGSISPLPGVSSLFSGETVLVQLCKHAIPCPANTP